MSCRQGCLPWGSRGPSFLDSSSSWWLPASSASGRVTPRPASSNLSVSASHGLLLCVCNTPSPPLRRIPVVASKSLTIGTITHLDLTACTYKEMCTGRGTRASLRPLLSPPQTAGLADPEQHAPPAAPAEWRATGGGPPRRRADRRCGAQKVGLGERHRAHGHITAPGPIARCGGRSRRSGPG